MSDESQQILEDKIDELKEELLRTQIQLESSQSQLTSTRAELLQCRREVAQWEHRYSKLVETRKRDIKLLTDQIHSTKPKGTKLETKVATDTAVTNTTECSLTTEVPAEPSDARKVGDLGEDGMPVWNIDEDQNQKADGELSIAEGLKVAATEALQENGVVYHEESGLYYDYSSGYYFDPERSLYYEPNSGVYYLFDHDTQQYNFHSQVDVSHYYKETPDYQSQDDTSTHHHNQSKNRKSRTKSRQDKSKETLRKDEKELKKIKRQTESLYRKKIIQDRIDVVSEAFTTLHIDSNRIHAIATEPKYYPPCIRMMVTESDTIDVGSLMLMTCNGGTIGREKNAGNVIIISDMNISKVHVDFKYRQDLRKYTLSDLATVNGTLLNGHRLSLSKEMSSEFPVSNGDIMRLGGTTLNLHIHPGTDTCDTCEPGQVLAALQVEKDKLKSEEKSLTKAEKENLRRKQLRQIKKKFGLENTSYVNNTEALNNPEYEDKAEERRRTKGSDNPYQADDAPASVDRPIEETNKGHKLLEKLGWKEGHGLGRSEQGLCEPVQASIRCRSTAGLGADAGSVSLDDVRLSRAAINKSKTRSRFQKARSKPNENKKAFGTWVKGETMEPT